MTSSKTFQNVVTLQKCASAECLQTFGLWVNWNIERIIIFFPFPFFFLVDEIITSSEWTQNVSVFNSPTLPVLFWSNSCCCWFWNWKKKIYPCQEKRTRARDWCYLRDVCVCWNANLAWLHRWQEINSWREKPEKAFQLVQLLQCLTKTLINQSISHFIQIPPCEKRAKVAKVKGFLASIC